MDGWGLAYNFFYMPPERHGGYEIESSDFYISNVFLYVFHVMGTFYFLRMMCQQLFQQAGEAWLILGHPGSSWVILGPFLHVEVFSLWPNSSMYIYIYYIDIYIYI